MAQPPPRKGAYNKFVMNLHREQFNKLQAKNQQELDLLDDIRNFMKQKAAIEKQYAEGLLKLSTVYSSKKIATVEDLPETARVSEHENNIYQVWRIVLDENEKISKARLAAVLVFQEKISEEAKNLRYSKNVHAKKSLDRLQGVQKDVQLSVAEVDRTKRVYFSEESDALDVASKAQDADLKAKGKKRDVKSLFTSKSSLKKQAVKMSAKQDESDIKSTGARNDYMLSLVTANAHQDRYFHNDLQSTVREMEGGIYEKLSDYLGTFARTELLTCGALQNSFTKIRNRAETIHREYNYRCYLKAFSCLGDHVQYAFEPVEGDTITTITPSEHDGGYSLNYEARSIAGKLNQAVKTIRAFRKRIKACHHHKAKGLKHEPNDPSGPNLDDKIEELQNSIRNAETEKAKCEARLNKLREGGVAVDEYLDSISLDALEKESVEQAAPKEWSNGPPQMETPVNEESTQDVEEEGVVANGETSENSVENAEAWGDVASQAAAKAQEMNQEGWAEEETWAEEGGSEEEEPEAAETKEAKTIDPNAEVWKAVVLFPFDAQNEDELTVAENEEVDVMAKECDEEGWMLCRNKAGSRGYVPYNYVEVYDFILKDESPFAKQRSGSMTGSSGQVVRQPSIESTASWGHPAATAMPVIPEMPPPQELDSASEEESEDEGPPGLGPPPGPPPQINVLETDPVQAKRCPRPVSIQFGCSMDSEYCRALYDYEANGSDELSFKEDDVIHIVSRSPNGVEDGWWMGEVNGRQGLFPSIVVEECQANGDDWSPDVSFASPTSVGPPGFSPPPPFDPPGSVPPAPFDPPTSLPPAPGAPPASKPIPPATLPGVGGPAPPKPASVPPPLPANVPAPPSALLLPETTITITNPTPTVEDSRDESGEEPTSYHVENTDFSLSMSSDKLEQYNSKVGPAAPVGIQITCEGEVDPAGEDEDEEQGGQSNSNCLTFTEIMVTCPTPRTQSPVDENINFIEDQQSGTEVGDQQSGTEVGDQQSGTEVGDQQSGTEVGDQQSGTEAGDQQSGTEAGHQQSGKDRPSEADVATKGNIESESEEDKEGKVQEDKLDLGWANFQVQGEEGEEPESNWAEFNSPPAPASAPAGQQDKKDLPAHILDDLADSEAETEAEVEKEEAEKRPEADAVLADTSSDSEAEERGHKGGGDSSATESGDEGNSSEPGSPRKGEPLPVPKGAAVQLPPEDLDPKKMKKLETMKESPA